MKEKEKYLRTTWSLLKQRSVGRTVPLTEIIMIVITVLTAYYVLDFIMSAFHRIYHLIFATTL